MKNIENYNPTITAHMIVKNEDKWVWFSIMSVINFVDKMIIFDTGSKDKTRMIIKEILKDKSLANKIIYEEISNVTYENFYKLRQKQIEMTNTDYFFVVDGDEIWYKDALIELKSLLKQKQPHLIATKFINCCGDIFHYRNDDRETYNIKNITGSITIRVYSMKIDGIHCGGTYGVEGYLDSNLNSVQDGKWEIEVMNNKYLHTSLLIRSSIISGDYSIKYRRSKLRADWDKKFDSDFKYPEVFYLPRPNFVSDPFKKDYNIIRIFFRTARKIKKLVK